MPAPSSRLSSPVSSRFKAPYALAALAASLLALAALTGCGEAPSGGASSGGASSAAGARPETLAALRPLAAQIGHSRKLEIHDAPVETPMVAFNKDEDAAAALSDFKGRVVLVNFWATFCGPCLEEMPALAALQASLGGADFEVVTINLDPTGVKRPLAWLEANKVEGLAFYHDRSLESARTLGAPGMPTTVLIDRSGREVGRLLGAAEWNSEPAIELIKTLIRNEPRSN